MAQPNLSPCVRMKAAIHLSLAVLGVGLADTASAQGWAGASPPVYGSVWTEQQRNHEVTPHAASMDQLKGGKAPGTADGGLGRPLRSSDGLRTAYEPLLRR
jgi:hypothetical protein